MDTKVMSFRAPHHILAGLDSLERLGEEAKAFEAKKALLVPDKGVIESGVVEKVQTLVKKEDITIDVFDKVVSDPDIGCAEACIEMAKKGKYGLILGVGGGSSMDIASVASVMCTNPGTVHDYLGIDLVKNPGIPTIFSYLPLREQERR